MSEGVGKKSVTEVMLDNLQKRNWNLQEKVGQLEKEKAALFGALSDWINFENQQIEKEGPYVGAKINELIKEARRALGEE